ncbi:class I SAM-dependent methyltransferase [Kitasatospora purpeofusca]|uniref:class I SAM-dependent methyltransferase n=1 Tax=Kitasatospora purpeofusca TaxID=67352 RepID=UPI0035D864C9
MPTSDAEGKDWSLDRFLAVLPDTVTDIGPGLGTYAQLLRPHHRGHWTAIEIHRPYIDHYGLRLQYDEVHHLDAREAPDHLYDRDLVIAGDILEHMPPEQAIALLYRIVQAGARHLLVSLPIIPAPQGEVDGNPWEAHMHDWTATDMDHVLTGLGGTVHSRHGHTLGCWWWSR